ncbi:MAG: four helix bundle protein [Microscillaceae bacterium]|nr:four helix bundle protein [Microscillaceae bacterium]
MKVVRLCGHLQASKKEFVISQQLLRSGTSIGANLRFAFEAINPANSLNKLQIAEKKVQETIHYLELIEKMNFLSIDETKEIKEECQAILAMIQQHLSTLL